MQRKDKLMSENNKNNIPKQKKTREQTVNQEPERKIRVKVKRASRLRRSTRRTINIVDILIIFVIVALIGALIVGISLRNILFGDKKDDTKMIEYVILFSGIDESLADTVRLGDEVYTDDGMTYLGQISAEVEVDTYSVVGYKDGTAQMMPYPDKVNLTVTIRVDASYSDDNGYSVDGNRIALGRNYKVRFPGLLAEGECISIGVS